MEFDYFSCIEHSVIVDERNLEEHASCQKVGVFFQIKKHSKKIMPGLVSKKLINSEREKQSEARYEKHLVKEAKQKVLAQERFAKQIPSGDVIINLLEITV